MCGSDRGWFGTLAQAETGRLAEVTADWVSSVWRVFKRRSDGEGEMARSEEDEIVIEGERGRECSLAT